MRSAHATKQSSDQYCITLDCFASRRNDANLPLKHHGIHHHAALAEAIEQHRIEIELIALAA